jgi:hypothetical protein
LTHQQSDSRNDLAVLQDTDSIFSGVDHLNTPQQDAIGDLNDQQEILEELTFDPQMLTTSGNITIDIPDYDPSAGRLP